MNVCEQFANQVPTHWGANVVGGPACWSSLGTAGSPRARALCGHEVANVANHTKSVNIRQQPFLKTVGCLAFVPNTVTSLFKKEKLLLHEIKN